MSARLVMALVAGAMLGHAAPREGDGRMGTADHLSAPEPLRHAPVARPTQDDSGKRPSLPLTDAPSSAPGDWLALFITGDGGYVDADRRLVGELTGRGIGVVVLDARAYLNRRPTPDEMSQDMATVLEERLQRWTRSRLVLIGSSRGADLMPFLVNRFPQLIREKVGLMALFGLAQWASFEFHWSDLFMDTRRSTDLPVLPELERLRGTRILCVYGEGDRHSFCRGADSSLVVPIVQGGGHRLKGTTAVDLARLIAGELP